MSDDVRVGLVVGGAALVMIAILWWAMSRTRSKRRLVRQLRAADAQERAQAGIRLVDLGLVRAARPLLDHVSGEQDARVRLAIALAVARRQWEPNNANRVARLRDWASVELGQQGQPVQSFGPAMTRISDMGGPRPDSQDPAAAPTVDSPTPDRPGPESPVPVASDPPTEPESTPEAPIHWQPGGGA